MASARRTYGGALKLATGLRLAKAISFGPARSKPLGIVKDTVVQAAFAPFPTPSQFTNGLGPEKTDWPLTSSATGLSVCHSSSNPAMLMVAALPGVASSVKPSVARG